MGRAWQVIKSKEINVKTKYKLLLNPDKVSEQKIEGIIEDEIQEEIPEEILELKRERDIARAEKDWQKNDELRIEIEREGYTVEDKSGKTIIKKRV